MITLRNISVTYDTQHAVKTVTADAEAGKLIALLGPNGSGKSSLIKAIAGVIPYSGKVAIGQDNLSPKQRARQLAYLAQERIGAPLMPVRDVVGLGRVPHLGRLSRLSGDDSAIVDNVMAELNLRRFDGRNFGELSGGEQARALLGRAMAVRAPILLADEPIAALDPAFQLQIIQTLKDYAGKGNLVIAALHDLSLAENFADEIWVMNDGKLTAQGDADKTLSDDVLRNVFGVKRQVGSTFTSA